MKAAETTEASLQKNPRTLGDIEDQKNLTEDQWAAFCKGLLKVPEAIYYVDPAGGYHDMVVKTFSKCLTNNPFALRDLKSQKDLPDEWWVSYGKAIKDAPESLEFCKQQEKLDDAAWASFGKCLDEKPECIQYVKIQKTLPEAAWQSFGR